MPRVSRSALVAYSAKQMFDLVNDVNAYPQFVPGCSAAKVLEQNTTSMTASVEVSKVGIRKTFVTKNTLTDGERIDMALVNGPFRSLQGGWRFTPIDDNACQIELNLQFEFTNALVEMAFGKIFHELTLNMVNAFTVRAKTVYGE